MVMRRTLGPLLLRRPADPASPAGCGCGSARTAPADPRLEPAGSSPSGLGVPAGDGDRRVRPGRPASARPPPAGGSTSAPTVLDGHAAVDRSRRSSAPTRRATGRRRRSARPTCPTDQTLVARGGLGRLRRAAGRRRCSASGGAARDHADGGRRARCQECLVAVTTVALVAVDADGGLSRTPAPEAAAQLRLRVGHLEGVGDRALEAVGGAVHHAGRAARPSSRPWSWSRRRRG